MKIKSGLRKLLAILSRIRTEETSAETLGELILGILLYGIALLTLGIIFIPGRLYYALGFIMGIIAAIFIVINMYDGLNIALSMRGADSAKYVRRKAMVRLLAAMVVMVVAVLLDKYCFVGAVIALITIKISAASNRLIHKKITLGD